MGEDLLVAPITDSGAVDKVVVFPPGQWLDPQGGNTYQGPTSQTFTDLTLETMLYFVRQ